MIAVTLQQLWARKRRLVGTGLAVVFGIAFLSGTMVLSDTMRAGFETMFGQANAGIDAVVRGEATIGAEMGGQTAQVDAALLDDIRAVDGVATAAAEVEGIAQVVADDGTAIGGDGPPTLGLGWIDDPTLSSYELVEGRAPVGPGEVAIDTATADRGGLVIGDTTVVRTPAPVDVTVVGLVDLAGGTPADGPTFTLFDPTEAGSLLLGRTDVVTRILVAADPGVEEQVLVDRIEPLLPDGTEALTGTALNAELVDDIGADFLDFFERMLLVFAGIALLVATFSIFNTFSITTAQRTQQSALLRTLGATRRQVLGATMLEASVVGVVASAVGLLAGLGLATGLTLFISARGWIVDTGGPVVLGDTVTAAMVVGLVVTVVAGVVPAIRASAVAPLEALRSAEIDRSDTSLVRAIGGALLTAVGLGLLVVAPDVGDPLLPMAGGAVATLVGVVVLGPVVARPATGLLGTALLRLRGGTGALARENAMRNPRRTAATASALMVGVAVVTLFTVVGSSVRATLDTEIRRTFGGDLVVMADGFSGSGLDPALAPALQADPAIDRTLALGLGVGLVDGEELVFSVADPAAVQELGGLEVTAGDLADVDRNGIAVSAERAAEAGLTVGDSVTIAFVDGAEEVLTVGALFEAGPGDGLSTHLVATETYAPHAIQRADTTIRIMLADGVSVADGRAAVEAITSRHGSPVVLDRDEFSAQVSSDIDGVLAFVYGLLALAIVIASMGIANALSLSVHERVREIGLLRAVGQTRRQLRGMVRWESVLVAVFGTVGGLGLGSLIAWAAIRTTAASEGIGTFALPTTHLAIVLALGATVGILAAVRPARRAARVQVLTAIATE